VRKYTYEEIIARDKTSLDITWLKDKSLADLDNLPDPDVLAEEIAENLESGLASFQQILSSLLRHQAIWLVNCEPLQNL
jgi:type I restriction enzyme M protein